MYWCLPAANIYDKQQRVCSHRFTPTSRDELRKLTQLVPRLRELSILLIVCSDLDAQSGDALARRLNVPYEEWQSLRRINAGKLHGTPEQKFSTLWSSIAGDVPVRGGDSHTSFAKRMAATRERLLNLEANMNLYVIKDSTRSHYKIGIAANVKQRLAGLQTGNPAKLEIICDVPNLVNARYVERALHEVFRMQRIQGEWFELTLEDVAKIPELAKKYGAHHVNKQVDTPSHTSSWNRHQQIEVNWREDIPCLRHSTVNCSWCKIDPENTLVIADAAVLKALTSASGAQRYRVYEVPIAEPDQAQALHASAASR